MKRRRAGTLMDHAVTVAVWLVMAAILYPVFSRAHNNSRRANCQSNQKQIAMALLQYADDGNGDLPGRNWAALVKPYTKEDTIFRCPAKNDGKGSSDYFFNAYFLKKELAAIQSPQTLVLLGDGQDDWLLSQRPASWLTGENLPAWRHLDGANYCFADGHIKWFKPKSISGDFRLRLAY